MIVLVDLSEKYIIITCPVRQDKVYTHPIGSWRLRCFWAIGASFLAEKIGKHLGLVELKFWNLIFKGFHVLDKTLTNLWNEGTYSTSWGSGFGSFWTCSLKFFVGVDRTGNLNMEFLMVRNWLWNRLGW